MQGTSETGYSGTDLDLKDRNIPVKLSPSQNAAVVEFRWSDNFSDFDPSTHRYSLSISPLVQRTQTFYFTVDVPTSGSIEVWGRSLKDESLVPFGKFENFTLSTEDSQRILFVIDFQKWTLNLESQNMTGSIPLPNTYRNLNLTGLDLGLSQIPMNVSFLEAMNTGSGTYSSNFQKVEIGSKTPTVSSSASSSTGPAASPSAAAATSDTGTADSSGSTSTGLTGSTGSTGTTAAETAETTSPMGATGTAETSEGPEGPEGQEGSSWDQVHSAMLEGVEPPVAESSGHPQLVIFILVVILIFFLVMMKNPNH